MRRQFARNLLFFLPALTAFCLGQSPSPGPEMLASFTMNRSVNEVNLVFSVSDSHGRLRTDLTQSDFDLLDNQHPPAGIRYFQRHTELPLRVALERINY